MRTLFSIFASIVLLTGCNFSKSIKVDLITGLTLSGNQLSCDDVFLSVKGQKVNTSTFTYGEKFSLNFKDLKGMKEETGKVFPDLGMFVIDASGDTIFQGKDMYAQYTEGINSSPVVLSVRLTAASPMHSGKDYTLIVRIKDKKDSGTFTAKLTFRVVSDQEIKIEAEKVSINEVYLFSKNSGEVITDNKVKADDKVYLIFEGVKGFNEINGKIFPGLSMKATGSDGTEIFSNNDLFSDFTGSGLSADDFKTQVLASLTFSSGSVKNPVRCNLVLWDKKGDSKINVSTDLEVN